MRLIYRCVCLVAVIVALGITGSAGAAEEIQTEMKPSKLDQSETDTSHLSASERVRAEAWELSELEWRRYQFLLLGIRGSVSPATLSPIEVLGIHARDDAERNRYAERWAEMMREDAERILAFQHAYDEAGRRLFPGELLIDRSPLTIPFSETSALGPSDRVLFFARSKCGACDAVLERLLARLELFSGVDIYLEDLTRGDEETVREWARVRGIRPEWVKARQVTLNFEGGVLDQLAPLAGNARPYLMRRRGDAVTVLPASAL